MRLLNRCSLIIVTVVFGSPVANAQSGGQAKSPEIVTSDCVSQPDKSMNSEVAKFFLQSFGIDLQSGIWKCTVLKTRWLKKGSIFSFRLISAEVDVERRFSIVVLDRDPHFWMVPISSGMAEYPDIENEAHNRAAFNSLIADNQISPEAKEMWISLALLYLNLTGNEIHVEDWKAHGQIVHGVSSSASFFKKASLTPSVKCRDGECTVTVNDTLVTSETGHVTAWVLTFSKGKNGIRLDSVDRKSRTLDGMK